MKYLNTILLFLFLIFLASCSSNKSFQKPPGIIKGVLDLRNWDLIQNGALSLSGEWEFYWEKFVTYQNFEDGRAPQLTGYIKVPGYWNGNPLIKEKIPFKGYATYHVKILHNYPVLHASLKLSSIDTAYDLYVDGIKYSSVGRIGKSPGTTLPAYLPHTISFSSKKNEIDIILHVSNYSNQGGGISKILKFGTETQIIEIRFRNNIIESLLFGIITFMGLYLLLFFLLYMNDKTLLFFGLFCLLIALRSSSVGEKLLFHFLPFINYEISVKIEYISWLLSVPVFIIYIESLSFQKVNFIFLKMLKVIFYIAVFIAIITPAVFFTHLMQTELILTSITAIYILFILLISYFKKDPEANIILPGFFIFFITIINDSLYHSFIINTMNLVPIGLLVFIISQTFLLSIRFVKSVKSFKEAELKLLQEKMSPHFLFNSLNTIHSLMYKNITLADQALLNLAHNYRFINDRSYKSEILFDEEWQFVKNYLELEELRFQDRLVTYLEKKGDFSDVRIPPLILQPIVENCLKHGLKDKTEGGFITLVADRKGKKIIVKIIDNGKGLNTKNPYSRSLGNILKRLNHNFENVELDIRNRSGGGVQVLMSFEIVKIKGKKYHE